MGIMESPSWREKLRDEGGTRLHAALFGVTERRRPRAWATRMMVANSGLQSVLRER